MPLAKDLLNPSFDFERRQHKKKRLVQCPNSYFMDVKCPDSCAVCGMFHSVVSAHRREGQADRGLLFQKKATLRSKEKE